MSFKVDRKLQNVPPISLAAIKYSSSQPNSNKIPLNLVKQLQKVPLYSQAAKISFKIAHNPHNVPFAGPVSKMTLG
jgi:hypothetical protein